MPKRYSRKIPNTICISIDKIDASGLGVGQWNGKTVVVHGALPNEQVDVHVEGEGQHRIHGTATTIIQPSPHRVTPRCAIVDRCGGCTLQRLDPKVQREMKRQHIVETLGFLDKPSDVVHPFAFVSNSYGYRNKALWMTAHAQKPNHLLELGLFRPWSHDLVPLSTCPVQDPPTEIVLEHLPDCLRAHNATSTWLRAVLVRSNGTDSLVTLVVNRGPQPQHLANLVGDLLKIPTVLGIAENKTNPLSNAILGPNSHMLGGIDRLLFEIGPTRFFAGPTSFVQTNSAGAAHLIELVRSFLPGPYATLVDLYSGVGMFALAMCDRASRILAVEASPDGTAWARYNFSLVTNPCKLDSVRSDVTSFVAAAEPVDAVILDPPRAGCGAQVASDICARLRPSTIVYVSCNPTSFARDAAIFLASGYRLTDVVPVDMFPHTPHVELVAKMSSGRRDDDLHTD